MVQWYTPIDFNFCFSVGLYFLIKVMYESNRMSFLALCRESRVPNISLEGSLGIGIKKMPKDERWLLGDRNNEKIPHSGKRSLPLESNG